MKIIWQRGKDIMILILFFGGISWFLLEYYKKSQAYYSPYITIGIVVDISPSSSVYFDYKVQGKLHNGGSGIEQNWRGNLYHPKKGQRYFVRFLKNNPYYSIMLLDKPVPDSIKEAPSEGWVGLPVPENASNEDE